VARNEITIAATPEQVMTVLLDPSRYPNWVVGAKHVRGVDAGWPDPGSAFHHTVGVGPLAIQDRTEVLAHDERSLILEARAFPAGRARVEMLLTPSGDATQVTMIETPRSGAATVVPQPIIERVTHERNRLSLARLADTVTQVAGLPPRPA
jgi:uncharacterized protein YndB with AHSA1/START domain